ncbi:MAG TPA: 2-oxoglutarate dehydrogenase complex dihydrolipoyllysine-residue succinyltransferase [Candidatus Binatia bacterium]|nr:2-oxoglutarate dehydrogenase complex dihydrolipoyllysine-residue succinyltransferase [Candidatus Binatia bacterium]
MAIELKVPEVGESITEVEIGDWLKRKGETVQKDEPVVTLESEKATVELPAPIAGTVTEVLKKKGDTAKVGEVIAYLEHNGQAEKTAATEAKPGAGPEPTQPVPPRIMPAAARALEQNKLRPEEMKPTGPGGRLLKEDVQRHVAESKAQPAPATAPKPALTGDGRQEEIVPMTRLRRTVAERLVQVQQTAALLTTFNEVDMSAVMALRKEFGETFLQKHNVKLGFMSFFVKASIEALKQVPVVNAEVRETNIVYHNYYDIGVAIGGGKGLVVPVIRNAERMSFAEIEIAIAELAKRAKENKLKPEELRGGTFTITNGGIYGSLMSTPLINPPQSGILGMHAIQERPVAREGNVVVRPMMYLALTYDHRIVDGREAVTFLRHIKEFVENPARMLLEV